MHTFDERGEAAIVRLRKDRRFNEALYRELGPVKYWAEVARAEREMHPRNTAEKTRTDTHERARAYLDARRREDEMISRTEDIPLESNERDRAKAVNIATAITLVGGALICVSIALTITTIICYKLWTWAI